MNTTETLNNALEFVEELDREMTLSSNLELKRGRLEQEIVRALAAQPANAPAAEPVSVREIDYTELIRAGFKLHGYAQGTRGCVAFKHGAEWFRSVCNTNAQPASEPMTREWRLLNAGEPIEACDELLEDDCVTWGALVGWEVGLAYNPTLNVPMRRRITIQDGGKVKAELTRLEATPDTATK